MSRFGISNKWIKGILLLILLTGIIFPIYMVVHAHITNDGIDCFPLDDPWIHLTYARNLYEHGTFKYSPDAPYSQGSTSPLYTFILSIGYHITQNEKILSYVLGILFHVLFLITFVMWARSRLGNAIWVSAALLLIAFDSRIGILAVSGMETSLYLFLVALAFLARIKGQWLISGIVLGLSIWVRPDIIILILVFIIDSFIEKLNKEKEKNLSITRIGSTKNWIHFISSVGVLTASYFVFNMLIGGNLLPNTFAAKILDYRNIPISKFLTQDVVSTFTSNGWIILFPFAAGMFIYTAITLFKGRKVKLREEVGWILGLTLVYLIFLPFSHRFNRYLIPMLPAFAILSITGLKLIISYNKPKDHLKWKIPITISIVILLLFSCIQQCVTAITAVQEYRATCFYYWVRHERTGRWLESNTPKNAVIATHDVGAIAFYSRRKIVDLVGIIQPQTAQYLHKPNYITYLKNLFERESVTHLAVLRNWIEIANIKPIFIASSKPEILEVYEWIPDITHLMPEKASLLNEMAKRAISQQKNLTTAMGFLKQSLKIDNKSSYTWSLLGMIYELDRNPYLASQAFQKATNLFPKNPLSLFHYAKNLNKIGKKKEAFDILKTLNQIQPDYPGLSKLYNVLQEDKK